MSVAAATREVCVLDLKPYYETLRASTLLGGMSDADLDALLPGLAPRLRRYQKDECLLLAGYETGEVGIILEGNICAQKNAPDGSRVVIQHRGPGGLFGDVLAGSGVKSPVTVVAAGPCLVLYLSHKRLLRPCGAPESVHARLLQNLVETISNKYFALDRRLELLMCKSLRSRISRWLLEESARAGADTFAVPLRRAELADYLNCDRSALSRELGRMQREGLLETWRGSFKLLDKDGLRSRSGEDQT